MKENVKRGRRKSEWRKLGRHKWDKEKEEEENIIKKKNAMRNGRGE
jgi:hypothetical protein